MPRKRKKNNKIIGFLSIIFSIIVLIIFIYFLKILTPNIKNNISSTLTWNSKNQISQQTTKKTTYYIGKTIKYLEWKVKYEPKIWYFFYELIDTNWNIFWLRSKNYSLWDYQWQTIGIKGKVVSFYKDIPIIEVQELKSFLNENSTWANQKQTKNIYYFNRLWLIIDFWENTWYAAKLSGDEIKIYKNKIIFTSGSTNSWENNRLTSSTLLLTISPFYCQPGSNIYDCKTIYNQFVQLKFENFTSSNGIKYFKIPEVNQWFATNNFIWWYYITPKDNQTLYKLSNYIYPYDIDQLKNKLTDIVPDLCKNEYEKLYQITDFVIKTSWDNLIWIVNWLTEEGLKATCQINIQFENNLPITDLINFKVEKNQIENIKTKNSNVIKILTGDWLQTNFSHWFNVWVPTKNIAYKQQFEKTNLWIENLNCDYLVKIIYWKNSDKLDSDPDITINRCQSNLDTKSLEKLLWKNIIVKQVWKYYYIIKFKSNWEDIAKNIKIITN